MAAQITSSHAPPTVSMTGRTNKLNIVLVLCILLPYYIGTITSSQPATQTSPYGGTVYVVTSLIPTGDYFFFYNYLTLFGIC
jgi:hypothetical protein